MNNVLWSFLYFHQFYYYQCYRLFLRRYCATYEECVFQKIILCMMSFCKKNHLSYLDTIESGAEEDIFQRFQELYIVAYLLSFERLFLFPKIWKIYVFVEKRDTSFSKTSWKYKRLIVILSLFWCLS